MSCHAAVSVCGVAGIIDRWIPVMSAVDRFVHLVASAINPAVSEIHPRESDV
jgi:hypothetical protein